MPALKAPFEELTERNYTAGEKDRIAGMGIKSPTLCNELYAETAEALESPDPIKAQKGVRALKNYKALSGEDLAQPPYGEGDIEKPLRSAISTGDVIPSQAAITSAQNEGVTLNFSQATDPLAALRLTSYQSQNGTSEVEEKGQIESPSLSAPAFEEANAPTLLLASELEPQQNKAQELLGNAAKSYAGLPRPDKAERFEDMIAAWPEAEKDSKDKVLEESKAFQSFDILDELSKAAKKDPRVEEMTSLWSRGEQTLATKLTEQILGLEKFRKLEEGTQSLIKIWEKDGPLGAATTLSKWGCDKTAQTMTEASGTLQDTGKLATTLFKSLSAANPAAKLLESTIPSLSERGQELLKFGANALKQTGDRVGQIGDFASKNKEQAKKEEQDPNALFAKTTSKILFTALKIASHALPPGLGTAVSVAITVVENVSNKIVDGVDKSDGMATAKMDGETLSTDKTTPSATDATDLPINPKAGTLGRIAAKGAKNVAVAGASKAGEFVVAEATKKPENEVPPIDVT
jgi:hypothetical protein